MGTASDRSDDMDQRDLFCEVYCRSEDVKYSHRDRIAENFEVLDSPTASGLKKPSTFQRRVFVEEEAAQREKRFLTGRQEYFKVSDSDESVLDLNEILKGELKNDNVQSFNTRREETMVVMKKQPDDDILEKRVFSEASTVRAARASAVSVDSRYTRLKNGGSVLGTDNS